MDVDLGDVTLSLKLRVKGRRRYGATIHVGAPFDTTPADRQPRPQTARARCAPTGRDIIMDLQADKGINLSVRWTDEVGNPVETPANATATWTADDPNGVLDFTDNGDGTATALSTGLLGTADVHMEATADGMTVTGDLQIVVVAGLAERANIEASEPFEVTPDVS